MLRKGATDIDMGRARGARVQEEDPKNFACADMVDCLMKWNIRSTRSYNFNPNTL